MDFPRNVQLFLSPGPMAIKILKPFHFARSFVQSRLRRIDGINITRGRVRALVPEMGTSYGSCK